MTAETEWTLADHDAFRRVLKKSARRIDRTSRETVWVRVGTLTNIFVAALVAYGFIAVVQNLMAIPTERMAAVWQDIGSLIIFSVLAAIFFALYSIPMVRNWLPYHRNLAEAHVFSRSELVIDADGFHVHTEKSRVEFAWSRVIAAFELPDHFIVMLDRDRGLIIPKRCLADETEVAVLRLHLKRHTGDGDFETQLSTLTSSMQLNTEDLRVFNRFVVSRTARTDPRLLHRRRSRLSIVGAGLFYIAFLWAGIAAVLEMAPLYTVEMVGQAIVPLICVIGIYYAATIWLLGIYRRTHDSLAPQPGGMFLNRKRLDFDRMGITTQSDGASSWHGWLAFLAVLQTSEHFFLMLDRIGGLIIPKRVFADDGELESFRDLARDRVGEILRA